MRLPRNGRISVLRLRCPIQNLSQTYISSELVSHFNMKILIIRTCTPTMLTDHKLINRGRNDKPYSRRRALAIGTPDSIDVILDKKIFTKQQTSNTSQYIISA